jgi:hypothetical protein
MLFPWGGEAHELSAAADHKGHHLTRASVYLHIADIPKPGTGTLIHNILIP